MKDEYNYAGQELKIKIMKKQIDALIYDGKCLEIIYISWEVPIQCT